MAMNNGEGDIDTPVISQRIVGEGLMVDVEITAKEKLMAKMAKKENKGNKRGRHVEKDGDKEDGEDLPGSKKSKKSPKKNQSKNMSMGNGEGDKDTPNDDLPKSPKKNQLRRRGRPGKNVENKEKCIFCQEEYLRETLWKDVSQVTPKITQVSICGSCHACLKNEVVIKGIRDLIKKHSLETDEANKKAEYFCGICQGKINVGFPTVVCTVCRKWVHRRCVPPIPWEKAVKNKNTFKCKHCVGEDVHVNIDEGNSGSTPSGGAPGESDTPPTGQKNSDKNKSGGAPDGSTPGESDTPPTGQKNTDKNKSGSAPSGNASGMPKTTSVGQRMDTLRLSINALTRTSWLQDHHIKIAIEYIRKYEENSDGSTLYFDPSVSHFIKMAPQTDVETQLNQNNAISKRHIVFIVNNCNSVLGSEEGSHWSLLIYEKQRNTWFHMDSGGSANALHAKQIRDKVDKCLVKQGTLENPHNSYEESKCTQQKNGYDCGPLTILFAMSTANKIAKGESLQDCWVNVDEAYSIRKWIHAELNNLLDLERGVVRTRDSKDHDGRSVWMKRKKVCWFYKHTSCKFGVNCTYWHPPGMRQKKRKDGYRDNSYRDHTNSHQGPYIRHPDKKYDRYTKRHQYPPRSYPEYNQKHNHNEHFLEGQWNPKNWPTPTEVDQAIKLIRLFRMGSSSGGPVRR